MALQLAITDAGKGITTNYHRITGFSADCIGCKATVTIASYVSADVFAANPVDGQLAARNFTFAFDPDVNGDIKEMLYAAILQESDFAGAVEVP